MHPIWISAQVMGVKLGALYICGDTASPQEGLGAIGMDMRGCWLTRLSWKRPHKPLTGLIQYMWFIQVKALIHSVPVTSQGPRLNVLVLTQIKTMLGWVSLVGLVLLWSCFHNGLLDWAVIILQIAPGPQVAGLLGPCLFPLGWLPKKTVSSSEEHEDKWPPVLYAPSGLASSHLVPSCPPPITIATLVRRVIPAPSRWE